MVKSSSAKQKEGGKAAPVKVKVGKTSVAANKKKPKIARPIPKSWPVSSHLFYPPPNSTTNNDDDNDDESTPEQQTSLKPGKTLQQNCNGCDVFLRKSAVQSTSASIIPTKQNSHSKGAVKRFLIVFPGRMTLKAPPAAAPTAAAAAAALKEDASKDETNDGDNDIKKDDNATTKEDKSEAAKSETAAKPTKRNPFAPANPPQLLGRLVSLGGADQKVELRIPFPSNNNTNDDNKPNVKAQQQQPQKQMVMSGRAIPLSGKYMVLSFKRTGGKDSIAASSASAPKNKKMGTGSIACKDIFRSVIVLGESQLVDKNDKKVDVGSCCGGEDVRVSHYGGSERTVDGGGKNDASTTGAAAKRKFKSVTAPTTSLKQTHDGDESSVVESLGSDSDEEDDDDDIEMKNGSDDEFVPISSKKRRSASATKKRKSRDSDEDTPVARKRTPRRSAAKAAKVKYVDDDSDVDMSDDDSDKSDDDNSGKSPTVTQEIDDDSDVSSVVEEIVPKKKRASVAPASKKRKLSGGSSRNGDADESSCIVIDSDDDDIKTPKPSSKTNGLKKATDSRSVTAKGTAKTVQAAPSSPLKSVSPRRRKKLSPNKPSPKKPVSLDLDDDPFAFL